MAQTADQMSRKAKKNMTFLRQLRLSHGLQLQEVAKAVGVHQSYMVLIEKKKRQPSIDVAKRLAAFYETTIEELFS
jgi:DNA-binding XRE family transcriptional regulator